MKQKVLLVDDDNESLLRSLRDSLSSETYQVVLAENVQQAIAKSEAGEIDLLLMSLDAPTEQRWEAIEEITEENPFLPVILITSQAELRNLAEAAGACALMEKPVDVPCCCKRYASCWRNRFRGAWSEPAISSAIFGMCLRAAKMFAACCTAAMRLRSTTRACLSLAGG